MNTNIQNTNNEKLGMGDVIKIGVMCSSKRLEKWQKKCLENILKKENAEVSLVILDKRKTSWIEKLGNIRPNQLLFQVYYKFLFSPDSKRKVGVSDLFSSADTLNVENVIEEGYSEYFTEGDITKIESYGLDFIIRFSFGIIRGDILETAKYGVWSFHHDDERKYRGGPPCFWEVYYGDEENGYILQQLTDRLDGGVILERGKQKTILSSYKRNLDNVYEGSTSLPLEACRKVVVSEGGSPKEVSPSDAKIYSYPTNLQFLYFLFILMYRKILSAV